MNAQMTSFLQKGVKLYYRILTLHRKTLPGQLRKIGDIYVKQQFRNHHTNPTLTYYKQFYNKWVDYEKQLSQQGVNKAARSMNVQQEKLLNNDQKEALNTLKQQLKKQ